MVLKRVRHVVEVLDARAADVGDAVAAFDAGALRWRAGTDVRQQHAAGGGVHGAVVGDRAEVCAVTAAVALHGRRGLRARVVRRGLAARHAGHDLRDHRDDALLAGEVDRVRHVFGRVIAFVRAGEEVQHRYSHRIEAGLV